MFIICLYTDGYIYICTSTGCQTHGFKANRISKPYIRVCSGGSRPAPHSRGHLLCAYNEMTLCFLRVCFLCVWILSTTSQSQGCLCLCCVCHFTLWLRRVCEIMLCVCDMAVGLLFKVVFHWVVGTLPGGAKWSVVGCPPVRPCARPPARPPAQVQHKYRRRAFALRDSQCSRDCLRAWPSKICLDSSTRQCSSVTASLRGWPDPKIGSMCMATG